MFSRAIAQQWLGALLCGAISAVLMAWLARTLGPVEFALLGTTLNASLIALSVMDGGWSTLMYRELSRTMPSSYAAALPAAAYAHVLIMILPCGVLLVVFTPFAPAALAAAVCMLSVVLMNQRSARMRAAQNFAGEAVWQLAGRVASALAIVIGVSMWARSPSTGGIGSVWVFLAWASGLLICLFATAFQWWCPPSWKAARRLYPLAFSMLLAELGIALMAKGDLVLLSVANQWLKVAHDPAASIGYAASARLLEAIVLAIAPLSNVVIAYLRSTDANRRIAPYRVVLIGAFILWLVGWAFWMVGLTSSAEVFEFVFGVTYGSGAVWLKWASLPLPWMLANLLLLQAVIAVAVPRTIAFAAVACALGFVVGSAALMCLLGAAGIGIAAALSQAALTVLFTLYLIAHRATADDSSR